MAASNTEKALDVYRGLMMKDIEIYKKEQDKQEKTDTQRKNWKSQDEIKAVYGRLEKDTKHLWSKPDLSTNELQKLMQYVVLSLYVLIPPRRLLDYTMFKLRDIDRDKDNYMQKFTFVFNTYKTAKTYKKQTVEIPRKLHSIVTRWSKKHDNDYLLFNKQGKPLTQPKLVLLLNGIFGGNVSVNILRHSFITNKLKDVSKLTELQEMADDMGHNTSTQLRYIKK